MANYSVSWNATNTASATVPMGCLTWATSAKRLKVTGLIVGSDATPADNAAKYAFQRTTARGTASTSITPQATDPADPAALATFDTAWSANPTLTANAFVLQLAGNQRATLRWFATYPGKELIIPTTAGNGLALMSLVVGGSAINTVFHLEYEE